jgi:calcium-dependent protein kinase
MNVVGCFGAGGQLWERVQAGSYSEKQAARIIRAILQLLAQAHSRNIIIRDIKPDNLLFLNHDEDAPLKAIDFGIATFCGPDDILEERCGT